MNPPAPADTLDTQSYSSIRKPCGIQVTPEKGRISLVPQSTSNPQPQESAAPHETEAGTNGDKLVVVMVGLPGRGKTLIARKLAHYLRFFHGAPAEVMTIGDYRRKLHGAKQEHSFFSHKNAYGNEARQDATKQAMADLIEFIEAGNEQGRVGVLDGANLKKSNRDKIIKELMPIMHGRSHVVFVECICTDAASLEQHLRAVNNMPDYEDRPSEEAYADFKKRIMYEEDVYEPMEAAELSWIKILDGGRQVTANNIRGFLQTRVLQFLLSQQTFHKPIYLSRHGQSMYNVLGKVGGDSELSEAGEHYACKLAEFVEKQIADPDPDATYNIKKLRLWTSSLQRTILTARHIKHTVQEDGWVTARPRVRRSLDELYAGIFDGMTYEEIDKVAPEEFRERGQNKLSYRYPRGESYLDVIMRLENIVHEMERQRDPVLIVAHQGVLRIVYAYLMGIPREKSPFVSIPLNTVIKLTPNEYSCTEERICLVPGDVAASPSNSH